MTEEDKQKYVQLEELARFKQLTDMKYQPIIADYTAMRNAISDGVTALAETAVLDERITALEGMIESDGDGIINKFKEVIAFLANFTDTMTLSGIVEGIYAAIAAKYTKPQTGIPMSDLAQTVSQTIISCKDYVDGVTFASDEEIASIFEE